MLGIDSNILLRILMMDTPGSHEAPHQFELVKEVVVESKDVFFVNHVVIAETIWILRQKLKYSKEAIAGAVNRLLHMSDVVVYNATGVAAALESFVQYPGDFSDHLIGEINKQNGCRTTLTFDKAASRSPQFSELQR